MIEHVILTRFNLATPGREEEIRNKPGWLARRFDLFERYCLPSMVAQTNQNFTWIIYFDEGTPVEFKERIARLRETFPFVPFYTGLFPGDGWRKSVQAVLAERGLSPDFLLSTRLDNDDALANDFVERMQATANARVGEGALGLNITAGCIMTDDRIYEIRHPSNAFFSLLEPFNDTLRTAPSIQHMTLAARVPVVQVDGGAGWLQVVHGENVSNKIRGRRVQPVEVKHQFFDGAVMGVPPAQAAALLAENAVLTPLRRLRDKLAAIRRQPTH